MLTLYTDIHNITRRKNVSVTCKDLVSALKKTSLTKEILFKKLSLSLLIFSNENNIAKLVGEIVPTDCVSYLEAEVF